MTEHGVVPEFLGQAYNRMSTICLIKSVEIIYESILVSCVSWSLWVLSGSSLIFPHLSVFRLIQYCFFIAIIVLRVQCGRAGHGFRTGLRLLLMGG